MVVDAICTCELKRFGTIQYLYLNLKFSYYLSRDGAHNPQFESDMVGMKRLRGKLSLFFVDYLE